MKKLTKEEEIEKLLLDATLVCEKLAKTELQDLGVCNYIYSSSEAVEELGLDEDLVHQLIEDYVSQVLKAIPQFKEYLKRLNALSSRRSLNDYTSLRELAHKNLGVARNLRIKDAEKILYILMKQDNLEYLSKCIDALEACAIKLKPICAYDTIKLMKIKNSL